MSTQLLYGCTSDLSCHVLLSAIDPQLDSLCSVHVPPPEELKGGSVIRISALGQRCVALSLLWKDDPDNTGRTRRNSPVDLTAGLVVMVNVKKK